MDKELVEIIESAVKLITSVIILITAIINRPKGKGPHRRNRKRKR